MVFAHGLDGGPWSSWGAFPARVAQAVPSLDVLTLSWPSKLGQFLTETDHTVPAIIEALVPVLRAELASYRRCILVLHCLGGLVMLGALHRLAKTGTDLVQQVGGVLLLDAPLLAPGPDAPAWIHRGMAAMGLEAAAMAALVEWVRAACPTGVVALRGTEAGWVEWCHPFALTPPKRSHRITASHTGLATAPAEGAFQPLEMALELALRSVTAGEF